MYLNPHFHKPPAEKINSPTRTALRCLLLNPTFPELTERTRIHWSSSWCLFVWLCMVYVWFMYDLILLDSDHIPNLDQQWNTTAPIISAWVKSAQLNPAALHSLGRQRTKKLRQIPASTIPAVPFTGKQQDGAPHPNLNIIIYNYIRL